jgi:Tol biopolymer transport system component
MNHKKTLFIVAFICIFLTASGFQTSPEYKILFEKAKFTMETKGDLNGAIKLFNDIINKYPKEREYAAKSQLYIGLCYEKSGVAEARKAYERVVRDYTDQSDIVSQAKVRLAALDGSGSAVEKTISNEKSAAGDQLIMRKLEYEQLNTPFANLSPDGKKIAYIGYVGGSPKRVDLLDLESGTTKVLVESSAEIRASIVWSPQSDKIAYALRGKELHIRNINGGDSQVLLKDSGYTFYLTDWSRNGEKILGFFEGNDTTTQIGIVTLDGQVKFLAKGRSSEFRSEPKISPNGSYVVCSFGDRGSNTDIYVWTIDGSRKVQVTTHPGRDENPVWSPDGKYIVFLSDRNRSVDLWGVQMKNGETVGSPFIIKQDIGWRTRINEFTSSGKLFLFMLGGAEPGNLFTLPMNQTSGTLNNNITPISVYPTDHFFPRYSPDGEMIAYLSRRGQLGWPKLFILDEKGVERELSLQGHYATNIAWHPRNKSLFFAGWDKTFKSGVYEISLENDEIKTVYNGEIIDFKSNKGGLININLLPDAGKIMFFRLLGKGYVDAISFDPDSQQPAVVLSQVKIPIWGLPSPTGENICYRLGDSLMVVSVKNGATKFIGTSTLNLEANWSTHGESLMFREGSILKIFSVNESNNRTLYKAPAGKTIGGMEMYANNWSPNGNRIIITERDTSKTSTFPQKLILINQVDGSFSVLGEAPKGYRLSELRWSPDGSKIVASGNSIRSEHTSGYEYWVLENFLPK